MTEFAQKERTEGLRKELSSAAEDAGRTLRNEADAATGAMADRAGEQVDIAADAAREAGDKFDAGTLQARAADELAAQLQSVAGVLRETDLSQAASHVSRFARDNPALFIGGAALLGFAAARFFKSSAPESAARRPLGDEPDPWTGHLRGASAPSGDLASRGALPQTGRTGA